MREYQKSSRIRGENAKFDVMMCAFVCAQRICGNEKEFKNEGKEAQNKPLFSISATFYIKTCIKGVYFASFDIYMRLMISICQNLHFLSFSHDLISFIFFIYRRSLF